MPGISTRSGAVAILAIACLTASCGPSMRGHPITKRDLEVPVCEGFELQEPVPFRIHVGPGGGPKELGGNNWIEFAPNAVDRNVEYQIDYLRRGPISGKKAGITIRQVGSAPIQFKEPVLVHLSYEACEDFPDEPKTMARFPGNSGNDFHGIGGAMSEDGQYVEVLVNDFSGFAIAI